MRRVRGFTLIEVLVALAIVAIGMAAVMGALSSSAGTVSYLRDKTFAQWVALNRIATIRISGQQPATGNTDGDVDYAGTSWHYRQEVVTSDVPGILRIDVKVRPKDSKAGDDSGWYTTVSGLYGGAVGIPNGFQPDWGTQSPFPIGGAGAGTQNPTGAAAPVTPQGQPITQPGSQPGAPTSPDSPPVLRPTPPGPTVPGPGTNPATQP